ncbi:helix-turn-helix domain-containing protein [Chryseobacterium rhizoplanae]|uniref:helix-turn-helix domain-containing protein n=1 Tax=Chryseobacterium rhizoplanae TaxID=1609531 RepID=UPI001CE39095|nr:helix-turn-helix domain-containing protein [Chryseobacterium rhizoplanae]UCA61334.1 helix-turn-helix domain-containing protein [Chryseobacterium rhizoplanae]
MTSNIRIEKVCQYCGTKFIAKTTVTRYCSHSCNKKAYKLEQRNTKIDYARYAIRNVEELKYQSMGPPVYLTVRETSAILKCSTKMVYFLISTGRLKAINLSVRKTRIKLQDLALIY